MKLNGASITNPDSAALNLLSVTAATNNGIHSADYIIFNKGNNIYVKSTANHGSKGIYTYSFNQENGPANRYTQRHPRQRGSLCVVFHNSHSIKPLI
ncbi:MAG: hypothetical protein J5545_05845 [Bacteroidaceae bacterium]|nr:hypothetical protein [Bacteroidaceae bacterium]